MAELGFNNILGEQEIDTLFSDPEETKQETEDTVEESTVETEEHDDTQDTTEDLNPDTLFEEEETPESVGGGDKKEGKEKGDAVSDEDSDTSPNLYSSIANALAVDGILSNLDDEVIKKANSAESFSDLIEAEVNARLDEKQQRVSKALENGVEPTEIRRYENTLNFINSITDKALSEEGEKGETLRRNLIFQDFVNKGYSEEKAQKFTQRTIDAGTDVEDAKEALQSNKEFFQKQYDSLLEEAEQKAEEDKASRQKQFDKLKTSLLQDKQLLGDMEISNDIRKKAFENIARPLYKDPETGEYLTALQKYELENPAEFRKYTGLIFTLTKGFTDFDSFIKGKVKKETKKGLRELEQVLNTTKRTPSGGLKLVGSNNDDSESYIGNGLIPAW